MRHRRNTIPPLRRCRECGAHVRTWRVDPLCGGSVCEHAPPEPERESIRAYLRRTGRMAPAVPADEPARPDNIVGDLPEGL